MAFECRTKGFNTLEDARAFAATAKCAFIATNLPGSRNPVSVNYVVDKKYEDKRADSPRRLVERRKANESENG